MNAMCAFGTWLLTAALDVSAAQTPPDWRPRVEMLIRQLGHPSFAKREAATQALLAEDEKIVPLLDRARKDADLELGRRIDRIRYRLVGYAEDLTAFLGGPDFQEPEARPKSLIAILEVESPNVRDDIVGLVATHQPRSGDFLLKIIGDPDHRLHRPATRLFCETWASGSAQQMHTYLRTSFHLEAVQRRRYPQGVDAFIETRFRHPYGSVAWPKGLAWQIRLTHAIDGKPHEPFVNSSPGGGAAAAWINAGKLRQGEHVMRFEVEYVFTHQGRKHPGKIQAPEVQFAVGPAVLADDLLAPDDARIAKQVREGLRFLDYQGQDGLEKVRNPWAPQITWRPAHIPWLPSSVKTPGVHVPVWSVNEPLPVDLCFDVTLRDVDTGKLFPCEPLVLHKGKTGHDYFKPRDAQAFSAGRDGFALVEIDLRPSRSLALSDPRVMSYFGWPIQSPSLRAKIVGEWQDPEIR